MRGLAREQLEIYNAHSLRRILNEQCIAMMSRDTCATDEMVEFAKMVKQELCAIGEPRMIQCKDP